MTAIRLPLFPAAVALSVMLHAAALVYLQPRQDLEKPTPILARAEKAMEVTFASLTAGSRDPHHKPLPRALGASGVITKHAIKDAALAKKKNAIKPTTHPPMAAVSRPVLEKSRANENADHQEQRPARNPKFPPPLLAANPNQRFPANSNSSPDHATGKNSLTQAPSTVAQSGTGAQHSSTDSRREVTAATSATASSKLPPLVKSVEPPYPEEARWEERTGKVTIKFRISKRGWVTDSTISDGSGHKDLDMAALRAIKQWQFNANNEVNADQWFLYSFRFELR